MRWFDRDLYGQELSDFEADPRFIEYQQIGDKTLEMAIPNVEQASLLVKIKGEIKENDARSVKVIPLWKKYQVSLQLQLLFLE